MSSKEGVPDRRRFVQTPIDLVTAYRTRGLHAVIYSIIARLCEVARGPVALSRDDLALLFAATREDPVGVQIERAIRDMRRDGWLLHLNQGQRGKRELLVTWGRGRDGQPRPWRFARADTARGRPAQMATARMPLALLDHYMGRLDLQPDAPAQVARYVSHPLLSLTDLRTFLLRQMSQIASVPPTPRLVELSLLDGVSDLSALLTQVDAGRLRRDDTPDSAPIMLTDAGIRQLQRCRATSDSSYTDAPHGSSTDPHGARHGSRHGSADSVAHYAAGRTEPQQNAVDDRAWDQDGNNKLTNMSPSSEESPPRTQTLAAAGIADTIFYVKQEKPAHEACTSVAACEEKHKEELDSQIATAHTLLNPARAIPAAEWWALGMLVQEQGTDRVLRWQRRAIGAGRTCITLPYYAACAATEALGQSRGRAPVPPAAPHPAVPAAPPTVVARAVEPEPVSAPPPHGGRGGASASSSTAPLSDAQQALIVQISVACGTPIRYPEQLAATPLPLLKRWAAIAAHPGLRAKGNPAALIVHAAARGKEPPTVAELNRWAEQSGTHWSQLGAWADGATASLAPPDTPRPDDVPIAAAVPSPAMFPSAAMPLRSLSAAAAPLAVWTAATLQSALHDQLRLMCPRRDWPLIAALQVQQLTDRGVVLSCATVQQHAQIVATLHGVIGSALDDVGAPGVVRIGVGARAPVYGQPDMPATPAARHGGTP